MDVCFEGCTWINCDRLRYVSYGLCTSLVTWMILYWLSIILFDSVLTSPGTCSGDYNLLARDLYNKWRGRYLCDDRH